MSPVCTDCTGNIHSPSQRTVKANGQADNVAQHLPVFQQAVSEVRTHRTYHGLLWCHSGHNELTAIDRVTHGNNVSAIQRVQIAIPQCSACSKWGHTAEECRSPKPACTNGNDEGTPQRERNRTQCTYCNRWAHTQEQSFRNPEVPNNSPCKE